MSRALIQCPNCGSAIAAESPMGLCLRCLFRRGVDAMSTTPFSEGVGTFGDYELEGEIARGGMGVVYRARQRSLDRTVALRMILSDRFAGPDYASRLRAEASAAASLRHPNVVSIYEAGVVDGQPFLAMEYVAGSNLAEILREGPMEPSRAARYLEAVARAVHAAHQVGILHHDLKPCNILIDAEDVPRVTDFGLARRSGSDGDLTLSGQPPGTPAYLPPEQVALRKGAVGPWSDVYSIGAVLYHLLTGRAPFPAASLSEAFTRILEQDPAAPRLLNPSVPRDLETICLRCLHKEPDRRYRSALEVAEELGRVLRQERIVARPIGLLERLWRWVGSPLW